MTVFVAYGYLADERWVHELVIPLLRDLGLEVEEGEEIPGGRIDETVDTRVAASDALIGFRLARDPLPNGGWQPSDWVDYELHSAKLLKKPFVQVVQTGKKAVSPLKGPVAGYQYLEYDPAKPADFFIKLVRHLRTWIAGEVEFRLAPESLANALATRRAADAPCTYDLVRQGTVVRTANGRVFGRGGGMYVKLLEFVPGLLADIEIKIDGQRWIARGVERSAAPPLELTRATMP
jgi:hypothetical protein